MKEITYRFFNNETGKMQTIASRPSQRIERQRQLQTAKIRIQQAQARALTAGVPYLLKK